LCNINIVESIFNYTRCNLDDFMDGSCDSQLYDGYGAATLH